jgi:hypothetical protein
MGSPTFSRKYSLLFLFSQRDDNSDLMCDKYRTSSSPALPPHYPKEPKEIHQQPGAITLRNGVRKTV